MNARIKIFTTAILILALGFAGVSQLEKQPGIAFLQGALTLGGGFLICGFFSFKMPWHGIIGAGVLAFIGFARGIFNLPNAIGYFSGDRSQSIAPLLELLVTFTCLTLLIVIWKTWQKERIRRIVEDEA